MKPWQELLFGLLFIIVGTAVFCYFLIYSKNYKQKNEYYIETTAIVVDYDYGDDFNNNLGYNEDDIVAIIVEYTVDGKVYRQTSDIRSNIVESIGTEVLIKYNPNNPKDIIWVNDESSIILPIGGGIFAIVGLFIVIRSIKKKSAGNNTSLVQQSNGFYNNGDDFNQLQNSLNMSQQKRQLGQLNEQANQNQQFVNQSDNKDNKNLNL